MAIEFKGLTFAYGEGKPVFRHFSARFEREKVTVLTGLSGCGKSTLLYLAAGLYPSAAGEVQGGEVLVEGRSPAVLPPPERCRLAGMMFQDPSLQFCLDTPERELTFCLENVSAPPASIPAAIGEALDFCGISALRGRTLLSLSGGERQKVALACLFALRPRWLLLDEPFANIDSASARAIAARLRALHDRFGTGILAVDHRLDNWLGIADEIRFLDGGEILPERMDASAIDEGRLESLGVIVPGRLYPGLRPACRPEGKALLELRGLSVSYGQNRVIDSADAVFDAGRVHAIIGESGCGKSTLFGALSGLCRYSGQILFEGRPLRKRNLQTMGFVTQSPQDQFVGGSVLEEVRAGFRRRRDADARAEEILRAIRLWRYRDVSPYLLSQGQQRRLGVAALTACGCRLLVCDEPTYAQDRRSTLAVMKELTQLADRDGVCLIFSTHDRMLARSCADVIWEMKGGKLRALAQSRV
jgi:energy-coupling factor transporter ATP-binding protein EcfA2